MAMIHKSVRIPDDIIVFVEKQPGKDFSKKLVGILSAYHDIVESTVRQEQIKSYNDTVREIGRLAAKLRKANNKLTDITHLLESEKAPIYQLSFNTDFDGIVADERK